MKKRFVGAVVLVIIGVALPLLLVRCLQGGADTQGQATRMYEITPKGQAKQAPDTGSANAQTDANTGVLDGSTGIQPPPQSETGPQVTPPPAAVSPDNRAARTNAGQPEQTPPVAGNTPRAPSQPAGAANNGNARSLRRDSNGGQGWVVQVGSFSEEHGAQRLAGRLDNDFDAFYNAGQVNGKTYYRVGVGPFDSEADARAAARRLKRQGLSTLVRHAH